MIHETDGYHPVRLLWGTAGPPPEAKYTDWGDILSCDPYWAPPVHGVRSSPNYVAKMAAVLAARGEKEHKPVWLTPVLEWYSGHQKRATRPEEMRAQTYMAIIHRTTGLCFFTHPARHQVTWDMVTQVGREIRQIYPMLTAKDVPHNVTYKDAQFVPEKNQLPDVHAVLLANPAGGYALIAANAQPWPVKASFTIAGKGLRLSSTVKRKFESGKCRLKNGAFSDAFEPFGRHVYLLKANSVNDCIEVTVAQEAQKQGYTPETMEPRSGRPGHKNILRNPSFEEATMPNFPDYWLVAAHSSPSSPEERVGREKALYMLDGNNPYHGKNSLRIRSPEKRSIMLLTMLAPQHDRPTGYVWSVWLRAERDGAKAYFRAPGMNKATFTLTRNWKQYYGNLTMPATAPWTTSCGFWVLGDKGGTTVWADAMQFEVGVTPTDFDP